MIHKYNNIKMKIKDIIENIMISIYFNTKLLFIT